MSETVASPHPGSIAARGALPALVFFACLAVAAVFEPLSVLAVFGGIAAFAVLTASTVAQARHPAVAIVAASLAAALVTAGIVLGSWAVLPIFWCVLAASCGVHVALRLLERRGASFQVLGAIAGFSCGMLLGILSPLRHTTIVGAFCLLALGGLAAFRLARGAPVER